MREKICKWLNEIMKSLFDEINVISRRINELERETGKVLMFFYLYVCYETKLKFFYLLEWLKNKISRVLLCACYCSTDEESDYNSALKIIFENKDIIKPMFYDEIEDCKFMLFYSNKLAKVLDVISCDKSIWKILHGISCGNVHICSKCGWIQVCTRNLLYLAIAI